MYYYNIKYIILYIRNIFLIKKNAVKYASVQ